MKITTTCDSCGTAPFAENCTNLGKRKPQELTLQSNRRRIMHGKAPLPSSPISRNESYLRRWILHPPRSCLFAQKHRKSSRPGVSALPLKQTRRQALRKRLARIKAQHPSLNRPKILVNRSPVLSRENSRPVRARDPHRGIARPVVDHNNVVARVQRLEASPDPQTVILCVKQTCNGSHEGAPASESVREPPLAGDGKKMPESILGAKS